MTVAGGGSGPMSQGGGGLGGGHQSTNLGDILERVLDKGLVIAGDIQVNLLDIELLTIKVRLVIASLETAKEVGIDWWEHDPWLTGSKSSIEIENARLRERIAELESDRSVSPALGGAESIEVEGQQQDTDDDAQ